MLSFPNVSRKRLSEKSVFIYEKFSSILTKPKGANEMGAFILSIRELPLILNYCFFILELNC